MLTERKIRTAKAQAKPVFLWDARVKGLAVKITPTGAKSYVLNFRIGGRERRATLARCSEINLRDARARAGAELVAIRNGETDPLERRREAREAPTVANLIEQFLTVEGPARIERGRMVERTLKEYSKQAKAYVLPLIGKRRVADVSRGDVEAVVATLAPVTGNRVLALVSRLFTLAEAWGWRSPNTNPARRIEKAREEPRDRVLAPSELASLARALDTLKTDFPAPVAAILTAAVTGLRIGEVLSIRWEDVEFETGRLTMPATKTGRRVHDLPTAALEILSELPRLNAWAFTVGRGAHVSYGTARKHFMAAAAKAGLADVRLHDLRRTVMTSAAASGVGPHVLRDLLGHKTTSMADRYIGHAGASVRQARESAGETMSAMLKGRGGV